MERWVNDFEKANKEKAFILPDPYSERYNIQNKILKEDGNENEQTK